MNKSESKVYIVGAGPGDPDLISVKGANILKKADCVLYDFLSSLELLKYCPKGCEKVCVGKKDGLHLLEQRLINQLIYKKSQQCKIVVRLKGGDPFVFSRGQEEARYLKNKKVSYEVVPGITSAIAGPESAGIPLTIKNKVSSVGILTGRKKDVHAEIDAPDCQTLVYVMGVSNIHNIIRALIKSGRSHDETCAFIENATKNNQRVIKGTIATIESKVKKYKVVAPAVFVVGEVVKRAKESQ